MRLQWPTYRVATRLRTVGPIRGNGQLATPTPPAPKVPAEWAGRDPEFIGSTLADALLGMLGLAFVFVRLNEAPAGHTREIARFAGSVGDRGAQALGNAVDSWIGAGRSNWPAAAAMFTG